MAALDHRAQLGRAVIRFAGSLLCLRERLVGASDLADLEQRVAEVGAQARRVRRIVREQGRGTLEQADRGGHVPPSEGAAPGEGEQVGSAAGQLVLLLATRAQLELQPMRLLEVVSRDLGVLARAVHSLEPIGELLMQGRPQRLRDGSVGRLLDQDVAEAQRVLPVDHRPRRAQHLLADEGLEVAGGERTGALGKQGRHRARPQLLADHRRPLDRRPLSRTEPIEPGREDGLDRRRNRDLPCRGPLLGEQGEDLREEERVPLRDVLNAYPRRRVELGCEPIDQLLGLGIGEPLEQERAGVRLADRPGRTLFEQLRPGEAEEQDRDPAPPLGEVCDQVEQGRFGPVDVLEDHDDRSLSRNRLEQPQKREEDLLASDRGIAGDRVADRLGGRALGAGLTEDLAQGPERDPLAVRKAASGEDRRLTGHPPSQLLAQPRLADPGRTQDREQVDGPLRAHAVHGVVQLTEL